MAVGKAGEKADRDRLSIAIGGVEIIRDGRVVPGYDKAPMARHVQGREIAIAVDVGIGRWSAGETIVAKSTVESRLSGAMLPWVTTTWIRET